ncbi:hypothetical protein BGZ51_005613 [Haplosporangium sp. Z 767]|nr:hypothetical protein BGZ50_000718 [Haplosporangium sp. Z 11]KAF9192419.1 hypothetical protein BGZ51_005613 [Haplosporangium sp. Z 767]
MATGSMQVGNILLGNCIGKGAFGSVWRGLNLDTATTVAVKQINLSDIPSAELANIMMEIDLLKKLNHANIVKYFGFEKTSECLNIILELCENGSLRSLCKNFGKLPEHLGAMYITQVLDGLVYLHDQGVIHRDIKGANILATKDGLVKLADFGVATLSNDVGGDMSVAGTPYWMAPEIIELSGATTASDIWSVGCTVIELLDGEPPYHELPPMGALYRIVQDDHPPIPESVSAIVRDFLMQCFQKDCNLRVSAKKLSRHPWIQLSKKKASGSQRSREKAIPAYEEAVKSVQQWNEALKGSSISFSRNSGSMRRISNERGGRPWEQNALEMTEILQTPKARGREPLITTVKNQQQDRAITIPVPPSNFQLPLNNVNNTAASNNNNNNLEPEVCTDNWDDDFADGISSIQLAALEFRDQEDEISKTIRPTSKAFQLQPPTPEDDDEDKFEADDQDQRRKTRKKTFENKMKQAAIKQQEGTIKPSGSLAARSKAPGQHSPIDLVRSRSAPGQLIFSPPLTSDEFKHYREDDEDDYSDLVEDVDRQGSMYQDGGLTLQTRLSNHSWFGNDADSDEEDIFAEVDEGFDEIDLEANIAREKYARTCASIAEQFRLLDDQRTEKQLQVVCDRLITLLTENPDIHGSMISNHGVIPLLDLIETCSQQSLILKLLNILNLVIRNDYALLDTLCVIGAIPVLIRYTSKRYGKEIQLAAAIFIQQICHTNTHPLQMFIACRGLRVLIDFLQGNYSTQRELIWIAINGIHNVFNLQTPRNDFCRMLAKQGLLEPLSATLYNTIRDPQGASYTEKIVKVLLIFSQGDSPVKELLATRQIVHRMLDSLQNLPAHLCVMMLKCIKNISMNSNTLDVLQNASAIHTLVHVLGERTGPIATDVSNHVLTTLFNLCRINKARQEEAAQAGIIPHLQQIAESSSPLKQFALPILCDMAHAGRACRNILWNNDCLPVYLRLFKDPYWQVNAMDAVLVWLQDETTDIEHVLLQPSSLTLFVQAFLTAKANSFENILEPLYKILRISPAIACGIANPQLFQRLLDRLGHPKAVVRLNLLRILRSIFDVHPERLQLVVRYGIADVVVKIAEEDPAVLVKELAKEILEAFEESDSEAAMSSKEDDDDNEDGASPFSISHDRFDSTNDFFGLKKRAAFSGEHVEDEAGSLLALEEQDIGSHTEISHHLQPNEARNKGKGVDYRGVDELFEKEVSDLDVKPGWGSLAPFRQHSSELVHGTNPEYRGEPSSGSHRARLLERPTRDNSDDEEESSDGSENDLFVTSRGWIQKDDDFDKSVQDQNSDQTPIMEEPDGDGGDTMIIRPAHRFSHKRSQSLQDIMELSLEDDIEKSRKLLEGIHSDDISESMILRSELPKIRLELLDVDRFPAWNRRDLDLEYESDDDEDDGDSNDSDDRDDSSDIKDGIDGGDGSSVISSARSKRKSRKALNPRVSNYEALTSEEEMTKILKEYHGTRRKPLDKGDSRGAGSQGSSRDSSASSSGSSSRDPTIRLGGPSALSTSSSQGLTALEQRIGQRRTNRVVGSLASIDGWSGSDAVEKTSESLPGLTLATRQEYDSALVFSDDEDENDDEHEHEHELVQLNGRSNQEHDQKDITPSYEDTQRPYYKGGWLHEEQDTDADLDFGDNEYFDTPIPQHTSTVRWRPPPRDPE